MKYLIFTFLIILGGMTLSAQDTLYVKGKRKPLIVNITIVKKKSLNYTTREGGLVRTIKMQNVKKIKFYKEKSTTSTGQAAENYSASNVITNPDFDEFTSTFSFHSIGTFRYYGGLSYLHHIPRLESKSGKHHFFAKLGGGYYRRSTLFSSSSLSAKGPYLEFGVQMEMSSSRNPRNRFHVGLDFNNRWVEQTSIDFFGFSSEVVVENITEYAFQIPVGYTYRSPNGFYFTSGLEVTTEKVFPAAHIGLGFSFGK